eukprot:m.124957 g.124957  ORF g.124957 m.124957 type:complete len:107 (+) comp37862_c1_seq10:1688-2008(+)
MQARGLVCVWMVLSLSLSSTTLKSNQSSRCQLLFNVSNGIGSGIVELYTNMQQTMCAHCVHPVLLGPKLSKNFFGQPKEMLCDVSSNQIQILANETHDVMCISADG